VKREDFIGLPSALALALIWDNAPSLRAALEDKLVPTRPRPPKYDDVIYRKEGSQFASETDVEGLRYWQLRFTEGAAKGGQYAEKDQKRANALGHWITYRLVEPNAQWSGLRFGEQVTAAPPSSRPTVYAKQERAAGDAPPKRERKFEDEPPVDDDDIPF
jgi:hypothetical protein